MARAGADGGAGRPRGGPLARLRGVLPGRLGRTDPSAQPAPPRVAFTRQDAQRLNERFALLDRPERRAIVRAVNRGIPMERRRDAELAIGVARRQQRFWSRAWLLGPAIALIQVLVTPIGWMEGLLLAAWGSMLLGMMAAWWWTRARRAELENLRVVGGRLGRAAGAPEAGTSGSGLRRSRLPGGAPRPSVDPAGSTEEQDDDAERPGRSDVRPPRPRGRKRR